MTEKRQLRLGAFMRPVSIHTAWWRYPGAYPDANFNFRHIASFAQTLERGKFDAFFMADHLALLNMPMNALKRSATTTSFDPLTLAAGTGGGHRTPGPDRHRLHHVQRPLSYRPQIRLAWITSATAAPAGTSSPPPTRKPRCNFGLEEHVEHAARYRKAREFYDVVTGLWDSWADDAFIRDVENGVFFDPERMHVLNHKGTAFLGPGAAEHRPPGPGLAGDRAGRRV